MKDREFKSNGVDAQKRPMDDAVLRALDVLLSLDAIALIAHHGRSSRAADEVSARLEYEAVRCTRAGDGFTQSHRYDLAAAERERARELREISAALRLLHTRVLRAKATR